MLTKNIIMPTTPSNKQKAAGSANNRGTTQTPPASSATNPATGTAGSTPNGASGNGSGGSPYPIPGTPLTQPCPNSGTGAPKDD